MAAVPAGLERRGVSATVRGILSIMNGHVFECEASHALGMPSTKFERDARTGSRTEHRTFGHFHTLKGFC